ncbi:MAG: hypothetical protein ACRDFT_03785 [bacterium]
MGTHPSLVELWNITGHGGMAVERRRVLPGIILIVLGVVFLLAQQGRVGGQAVVAAIGIAFLVAFLYTRNYGFLVPGGIMTGLGLGIIYQSQADRGWAVLLGLGLGFVSIYALDVLTGGRRGGQWWPLIPGGILTFFGLAQASGILGTIGRWWPILLIVIGLYLLFRRRADEDEHRPAAPPP